MILNDILIIAASAFIVFIILEFLYSRFVLKKNYYSLADAVTSLNLGIFSQLFSFSGLIVLLVYTWVYTHLRLFNFPLHSIWQWVCALVIFDFLYYWTHRFGHEYTIFWANHVVHHSSEYFNLTTALRQPGTFGLQQLFTYLPLAFIGVDPQAFIVLGIIDLYYQFWVHTKCVGRLGWLDRILVTPTNHAVHHGVNQVCIDKNYGGVFIIWDRIFNTYCETDEELKFGTTKPVKSWNPLWINLEVFYALILDVIYTPGFFNKLKVLSNRTGERSEAARAKVPDVKFDFDQHAQYIVKNIPMVNIYAVFNFTISIIGFFTYFVYLGQISQLQSLLYLGLFMISAVSRGFLLNQKINIAQALMLDSIAVAGFTATAAYFLPGFYLGILSWLSILPMLIGTAIFFGSGNSISNNRWLASGILFTLSGGILFQIPSEPASVGFGLYLLGYLCYGIQLVRLKSIKPTVFRFYNLFIPAAFTGIILVILFIHNVNEIYIIAAGILLTVVGWLSYNALQLSNWHSFSWFKLGSGYHLVAIGAMLIMFHDGLVFLNLTLYNSSILTALIAVCYGIGQFMLINYATTDFQIRCQLADGSK